MQTTRKFTEVPPPRYMILLKTGSTLPHFSSPSGGANYEYSICVMKKLYYILKREKTSFLSVVLKNSRSLHSNGDYAIPNLQETKQNPTKYGLFLKLYVLLDDSNFVIPFLMTFIHLLNSIFYDFPYLFNNGKMITYFKWSGKRKNGLRHFTQQKLLSTNSSRCSAAF